MPRHVTRRAALTAPLLAVPLLTPVAGSAPSASAASPRWTAERAQQWYRGHDWLVGANFIPSNAINQLEMFQPATFDPRRIDAELHVAQRTGLNTVRVFLHDQLWLQDPQGFLRRLGQFVDIAARRGIRPMLVLFDSCWDPHPRLGRQHEPVPGVHNSGWVQSPGADHLGDPRYREVMRDYTLAVVNRFRFDDRVLAWDVWNEPDNPADAYRSVERPDKLDRVADLLPQVFRWIRSVAPIQPLTSAVWQGSWADPAARSAICSIQLDNSDIVTFHDYGPPAQFDARISELIPLGRPILCTEFLARTQGSTVEGILPIARQRGVGAFTWGLVAGKTQTYYPWDSWEHPAPGQPPVWFHDLFRPGGVAYRDAEVATIRDLTRRGGR
jgi:hypothetical protein